MVLDWRCWELAAIRGGPMTHDSIGQLINESLLRVEIMIMPVLGKPRVRTFYSHYQMGGFCLVYFLTIY
jgi:hypothetical protein